MSDPNVVPMNVQSLSVTVVFAIATVSPPAFGQTFTSAVDQVVVPVTIFTEPNATQLDLTPADFRVFDNGRPVPIVAFGRVPQSLEVLLLLDTSRSMVQSQADAGSVAEAMIAQLAKDDTVRVGIFSNLLRLSPPLSTADKELAARLAFVPGANITALYDALVEGCRTLISESSRRVIFVVSDGVDTASDASPSSVLRRAAEANVTIYAIGIDSRTDERGKTVVRAPHSSLRQIAEDTGGGYVYGGASREYPRLFAAMIDELHQQYMLGFTPAQPDGRLHSLTVTTRRPHIRLHARKQYLAPVPSAR
jgi:VWFA-related protein